MTVREGGGYQCGSGFGGQVELGVISVVMEVDVIPAEYVTKRQVVNDK